MSVGDGSLNVGDLSGQRKTTGKVDAATQTSFQRFISAAQRGMFGLGFVLAKDFEPITIFLVLGYMVDLGQLLSFPLSDDERMPWNDAPGVGSITSMLSFLTRLVSADENPIAFMALLVVAFLWIVCYLGIAYSVAARFSEDLPQSEMALRALRAITSLSSGPLYIPTSTVILQGIACEGHNWIQSGLECGGPGHGVIAFILSVSLLGFSGLAVFASLIWVDRSPASLNWGARQHGRYDAAMVVIKLLLGFCYSVLNRQIVGTVFMAVVLMLLGLGQAYVYAFRPVFVQRDINAMYCGGGCAMLYASLCLLMAQLIGADQVYLSVFIGIPAFFGIGFFAARRRLDLVGRGHLRQCQSLADVHVWARRRMQRYAALKHLAERSGVYQGGQNIADSVMVLESKKGHISKPGWQGRDQDQDEYDDDDDVLESASGDVNDAASAHDDGASVQSGNSKPSHVGNRSTLNSSSKRRTAISNSSANSHYKSATLLARGVSLQVADQLNPEDVQAELKRVKAEAERGYQYGMERFNRDEMAFLQYGVFIRFFSSFSFLECIALSRALRLNPSMDSRFYIFTRVRALRESDGSGLSPVDRVLFDGAYKEVMTMRLHAYKYMSRIWNTLGSSRPDVAVVLSTGIEMKATLEKIDVAFRRLMALNSESTAVLRALASYLIDLRSQPERATELLNKANRIEDSSRKSRMKLVQNVEFGTSTHTQSILEDGAAIITISGAAAVGSESKLGEIVQVTPSASRLFGYGTSQMIGYNIAIIVPPPIDLVHNRLMAAFGRKRTSSIVGATRLVFGQKRTGDIFPMWLQVSEAPPDEQTAEPRFSAVVHEVVTQQDFVIFGGPEVQFKIHGCSARTLEMLGLENEALQSEEISMEQFFPSIDSTYSEEIPLSEEDIRAIAAVPVVQDLEDVLGSLRLQSRTISGRALIRPMHAHQHHVGIHEPAGGGASIGSDAAAHGDSQQDGEPHGAHRGLAPIIGEGRVRDGKNLRQSVGFKMEKRGRPEDEEGERSGGSRSKSKSKRKKKKDAKASRHDQLKAAIANCQSARAKPMRQYRKPGIIPVRVLGVDSLIVGCCQRVVIGSVPTFYVLKYNALQYSEIEGESRQSLGSYRRHSSAGMHDGGFARMNSPSHRNSGSTAAKGQYAQLASWRFDSKIDIPTGTTSRQRAGSDALEEGGSADAAKFEVEVASRKLRSTPTAPTRPGGMTLPAIPAERSHERPENQEISAVAIGPSPDASSNERPAPMPESKDQETEDANKGAIDRAEQDSTAQADESQASADAVARVMHGTDEDETTNRSRGSDSSADERKSSDTRDPSSPDGNGAAAASAAGAHFRSGDRTSDRTPALSLVISSERRPSQSRGILKRGTGQRDYGDDTAAGAGEETSSRSVQGNDDADEDDGTSSQRSSSIRSMSTSERRRRDSKTEVLVADKAKSFHSGTGSTRSSIARIQQLSKGAVEPEIRSIRVMLIVLGTAVLALGIGIVLYMANVVNNIRNNSASVWIAGQRRRAMQTGIDAVLWMSFQSFDANGTVTGASSVLDSIEDTVRRLRISRAASDAHLAAYRASSEVDLEALDAMHGAEEESGSLLDDVALRGEMYEHRRQLQYSTNAETAAMASHGKGALELLALIADEIQIAQARMFEIKTDDQVRQFEAEHRTAMRLPQQAGGGTVYVPLVQHVQEIVAAMRRISRLNPQNVTVTQRDVLFLSLNSEVWDMAMGHSLEMRYVVYAAVFPRTVQEVVIFGSCVFVVYILLGSCVFANLTTRLGAKVSLVLQTFLLLPRSTARRLASRSQRQLNKVMREINSELASDSEDESEEESDQELMRGLETGSDAEATTRLIKKTGHGADETDADRDQLAKSLGQGGRSAAAVYPDKEDGASSAVVRIKEPISSGRSQGSRRSRHSSRSSSRKARDAAYVAAMANLRNHTDSSYFVWRSTVWLLVPILLVLGFIVFFVLWQLSFTQVMLRTSQRIIAASSLESQLAGTTNTMLGLNSAIARDSGTDRIIELARLADLQGQKTTAVSSVLTFGGKAVLTKLLVANSTRAEEVFGRISEDEVTLQAIESSRDPGGSQAYEVMHSDTCSAVVWPNISTAVSLERIDRAYSRPSESELASQEYADALQMCLETEGGVLGEGALSAIATVVFNLRQAVSAVFLDLTGLPPPSMRGNSADDISVIRRQRRALLGLTDDDWHDGDVDGALLGETEEMAGLLVGEGGGRGEPVGTVPGHDGSLWSSGWEQQRGEGGSWDWGGEGLGSESTIRRSDGQARGEGLGSESTIRRSDGQARGVPEGSRSAGIDAPPTASQRQSSEAPVAASLPEHHDPESRELNGGNSSAGALDSSGTQAQNSTEPALAFSTVATMLDFTFRIRSIVNPFLLHSISAVRVNFFLGLNASLISGYNLLNISAWVFVGVFLVTTAFYWPAVASLNVPLTSARQMLLLLPEETILRITVLRTALYRIATDHERAAAGQAKVAPEGGDAAAGAGK